MRTLGNIVFPARNSSTRSPSKPTTFSKNSIDLIGSSTQITT